jgi:hypothetical protein
MYAERKIKLQYGKNKGIDNNDVDPVKSFYEFIICSAALTEVFPCFSSVVRQMPGYNSPRRGTARTVPNIFVLFCVLFFVLFYV